MKHLQVVLGVMVSTTLATTMVRPVIAASARDVARVAVPTTVQINNMLAADRGGSGVIIAKDGDTYTVLTANHVVMNPNSEYEVVTSTGDRLAVTNIVSFDDDPAPHAGTDLAIVQFESDRSYAVAPIADSDEATTGSGIYVSGYPLPGAPGQEREYSFTNGIVSSVRPDNAEGYLLRYDAVTRRGMSGGPVFDVSGRVVGIHGQGERDGVSGNGVESGQPSLEIKTGFNFAVPVNTFVGLADSAGGFDASELNIDQDPPDNSDAGEVTEDQVDGWFDDFAQELLRDLIRGGIRGIFGF